jgi:hypothetical protein
MVIERLSIFPFIQSELVIRLLSVELSEGLPVVTHKESQEHNQANHL